MEKEKKTYLPALPGFDGARLHDLDIGDGAIPDFSKAVEGRNKKAAPQNFLSRRDFLKLAGFTFAVSTGLGDAQGLLAEGNEAIPYLNQPEDIVAGQPYFYRSTCAGCTAGCGLTVKARDGRPIKLEGNPEHPLSKGGLCPIGQASVLGPYDSKRLTGPTLGNKETNWAAVDREIIGKLDEIGKSGGTIRFLTCSLLSPTVRGTLQQWLDTFGDARLVVFDPLSCSAILDAHEKTFGVRVLPRYRFDRAEVICSFDADFLGTWISPVEFTQEYQQVRNPDSVPTRFSFHAQFEAHLTITGSKADRRYQLDPGQTGLLLSQIAAGLAKLAGETIETAGLEAPSTIVENLIDRLWASRGKSLVVCGSQDTKTQVLVNFINSALNNYGATLDLENPSYQRQGNDGAVQDLLAEIEQGKVTALFINGLNPVYELPSGAAFGAALARIPLTVSFSGAPDETTDKVKIVCPDHHYLESWGDAQPGNSFVSLFQPAMNPLGNTRALVESITTWMGAPRPAYDLLRGYWERKLFSKQGRFADFQTFWDQALNNGGMEFELPPLPVKTFDGSRIQALGRAEATKGFSLLLYPKVSQLQGHHAHNPWLQELPDPITKNTWDNYACISPATAAKIGVSTGDLASVSCSESDLQSSKIELPVQVQPGMRESVVAVALGYGRQGTDRFRDIGPKWLDGLPSVGDNNLVGKNMSGFLRFEDRTLRYYRQAIMVAPVGKKQPLACTQRHHTITVSKNLQFPGLEKRDNIQEESLAVAASEAAVLAAKLMAPLTFPPTAASQSAGIAGAFSAATATTLATTSATALSTTSPTILPTFLPTASTTFLATASTAAPIRALTTVPAIASATASAAASAAASTSASATISATALTSATTASPIGSPPTTSLEKDDLWPPDHPTPNYRWTYHLNNSG